MVKPTATASQTSAVKTAALHLRDMGLIRQPSIDLIIPYTLLGRFTTI
jgi:hypothetical protein